MISRWPFIVFTFRIFICLLIIFLFVSYNQGILNEYYAYDASDTLTYRVPLKKVLDVTQVNPNTSPSADSNNDVTHTFSPERPPLFPCGWTPESLTESTRLQAYINCPLTLGSVDDYQPTPTVLYKSVPSDVIPSVTSVTDDAGKQCLKRLIQTGCVDAGMKVPRVVHYVRFGRNVTNSDTNFDTFEFPIDAFFSFVSVARVVRPCLILLHGDVLPRGPYWEALLQMVPNVMHVYRERPTKIFNITINVLEHSADVARLHVLQEYGGIYLDMDQLVLHSLDVLMNESAVIGHAIVGFNCGNGFLISEPKAPYLSVWLANYTDFNDTVWGYHSTIRNRMLSLDHPHLVHVVDTFFKPAWDGIHDLFDRQKTPKYDWHDHFGLHLYTRLTKQFLVQRKLRIDYQDNVIGDIIRHVLYGDHQACYHRLANFNK